MRLYEFAESPIVVKLVAATNQLKNDIEDHNTSPDWTLDELLRYYRANEIIISKSDFYDMIKNEPLKNYISNIKNNKVIFKGDESDDTDQDNEDDPEKKKDIVNKMAKSALKK